MSESSEHSPASLDESEEERPRLPLRALLALLRSAGLLAELTPEHAETLAASVAPGPEARRWTEALRTYYYRGAPDERTARRRRLADRFYLHDGAEQYAAPELVRRLGELVPELPGLTLERLGGEEGVLVVRSGEQVAPVLDPVEATLDTGELDLAELEREGARTAAVQGIVRAVNVLLGRAGVARRFVQLRADETCEMYVSVTLDDALGMLEAGVLEDGDEEELRDFASW